jgi:uroporphyrinogen decarboxylase
MNSRERVLRALKFQGPDRAPLMHRTLGGAFRKYGQALYDLYTRYPSDVILSPRSNAPFAFASNERGIVKAGVRSKDAWGSTWYYLTEDFGGQTVEHPLEDWAAFDSYREPDPMAGESGVREMEEAVRQDGHQHYVLVTGGELFQRMFFLRGYENLLMDLVEDRPEVYALRDRVANWVIARINRWHETGLVDGILLSDDWGTQKSLMIKPEIWRRVFKPAYRRMVEAIHSGGATAHFHTDGVTQSILGDLIEIGLDEVNPQVTIMDVEDLGRRFGGRVCFRADLDRQAILPSGTPEEVEAHVRRMFNAFGQHNGGYIGYGQVGPDVPLANAEAMLRTVCGLTYST